MTFTAGQPLRYTGEADVAPINRTVTAPYGANHDAVSFRRHVSLELAEVMTTRGSRIVDIRDLTPIH
ncbi:MAG TPA: hypothetical protein VK039_03400 [Brevibacterium sp.]|nr:hypothetical protein [Brevibacterium sp.]